MHFTDSHTQWSIFTHYVNFVTTGVFWDTTQFIIVSSATFRRNLRPVSSLSWLFMTRYSKNLHLTRHITRDRHFISQCYVMHSQELCISPFILGIFNRQVEINFNSPTYTRWSQKFTIHISGLHDEQKQAYDNRRGNTKRTAYTL